MRLGRWAWAACAPLFLLAGCAGFWQNPNSPASSGCTTNCTTASSGNFYILNGASSSPTIVGQYFSSGSLKSISGSPWTLPSTPYAMALSPSGNYLYVGTVSGVFVFPVSGGALGSYSSFSPDQPLALEVDTSGSWLIEALPAIGGVTMAAVPLNTSTGGSGGVERTATYSVSNAAIQDGKMAIGVDDKYVFVALGSGGTIAVPFDAAVSAGSSPFGSTAGVIPPANSGGAALSVAVDPDGRLFYVGETLANSSATSGGLRAFAYSSLGGTLVQASGSPIASGGLAPSAILPTANGSYVYVANGQGTGSTGNIAEFSVAASGTTYSIATGSTATTGIQPVSLAQDGTGAFVLAVSSSGDPYFSSYTFDSATAGKLDVQVIASSPTAPLQIVATP